MSFEYLWVTSFWRCHPVPSTSPAPICRPGGTDSHLTPPSLGSKTDSRWSFICRMASMAWWMDTRVAYKATHHPYFFGVKLFPFFFWNPPKQKTPQKKGSSKSKIHGFVWKCRVPHCTQWFCWSLSLWKMAISLGIYPIFRQTHTETPSGNHQKRLGDQVASPGLGISSRSRKTRLPCRAANGTCCRSSVKTRSACHWTVPGRWKISWVHG